MKRWKKLLIVSALAALTAGCVFVGIGNGTGLFSALTVYARSKEESDVWAGTTDYHYDEDLGDNQPWVHTYRLDSLLDWDPETDLYAKYLRAQIPLQERIDTFTATQANTDLVAEAQVLVLGGDYHNESNDMWGVGYLTTYGDTFARYCFNFWQYINVYASWHGELTASVPEAVLDIMDGGITTNYEYASLNVPNPSYTNAAHKNGVMSLACIGLAKADENCKTLLTQDEDGNFPYAAKLAEMAEYFGYDGYFFNQEYAIDADDIDTYRLFLAQLREYGCYVQWYDAIDSSTGSVSYQNEFNSTNSPFVYEDGLQSSDSIFLNYWWNSLKLKNSQTYALSLGLNPLSVVFAGVEGGLYRWVQPYDLEDNKDADGQPRNSIAIMGADMVFDVGSDLGNWLLNYENDNQWKVFERERIWWSGPSEDPTDTGSIDLVREDLGIDEASNWAGVADQVIEKSVISGTNFYTNFNTGHGLNYYIDGEAAGVGEWYNITIQDILPTWQWWFDTDGTELTADFDYGEGYDHGTVYEYETVNPYRGADSLVVSGVLDADNFLHLYKSDLSVNEDSRLTITFLKTSDDDAVMKLGLIFEDDPDTVVEVDIPNTQEPGGEWITEVVSLEAYAGRQIAAFGLVFTGTSDFYQINVGELKITDGSVATPDAPTGVTIDSFAENGEVTISWDMLSYDEVKQYNIYAVKNGKEIYLGGTYDEIYYIQNIQEAIEEAQKTTAYAVTAQLETDEAAPGESLALDAFVSALEEEEGQVVIMVKAVSADGTESEGTMAVASYSDAVSDLEVEAEDGYLYVTWTGGQAEVTVTTLYEEEARTWTASGDGSCVVEVASGAEADGAYYLMTVTSESGAVITYNGNLDDSYCGVYTSKISGGYLTYPQGVDDWYYLLYTTVTDGVESEEMTAIRWLTISNNHMPAIDSDVDTVRITLVDYSGNVSETVEIPNGVEVALTGRTSAQAGATSQFDAEVIRAQETDEIIWEVWDNESSDTTIDENGLLTVGVDETASTIRVKAISAEDENALEVLTITIFPETTILADVDDVYQGDIVSLAVYTRGEEQDASSYTWELSGQKDEGTTLTDGVLTIAGTEEAYKLTITATDAAGTEYAYYVYVNYLYEMETDYYNAAPGQTVSFTVINQKTGETANSICTWSIETKKESVYGAISSSSTKVKNGTVTVGADETCTYISVFALTPVGSMVEGSVRVDSSYAEDASTADSEETEEDASEAAAETEEESAEDASADSTSEDSNVEEESADGAASDENGSDESDTDVEQDATDEAAFSEEVVWTVKGGTSADTQIVDDTLVIGADETSRFLLLTVTSAVNSHSYDTVVVDVSVSSESTTESQEAPEEESESAATEEEETTEVSEEQEKGYGQTVIVVVVIVVAVVILCAAGVTVFYVKRKKTGKK